MTQPEETREPRVGLNAVFAVMNENYRKEVVRKTLQGERQLAGDIVRVLQQAVQGIPAQGHRPGLGPLRLYQRHLSMAVCVERVISGAVLRGWIGLNDALRETALEHYRGRGILEKASALDDDSIDITGWDSAYDEAMEQLIQRETGHSKDDLMLMSYLLCGAMPGPEDEVKEEAEPAMTEPPPLFQRVLGSLHRLPLDSEEWAYVETHFPGVLSALRTNLENEASLSELARIVAETAASLAEEYQETLTFLEVDTIQHLTPPKDGWADPTKALGLLEQLAGLLRAYAPVREQARVRSEDIKRRPHREDLERQIDEVLAAMEALEVASLPPTGWKDPSGIASPAPPSAEIEALCAEITALQRRVEGLQEERDILAGAHADLATERNRLKEDVSALEEDLEESRSNEENFRQLYHLAYMPDDEDGEPAESVSVESVADAVTLAEDRFASHLRFNLNAKSDLDIPFDKPQQVLDALEWLATTYHKSKTGDASEPDLLGSLRLACGWKYTRFQSDSTMGMYREYYETTVDGRKCKLEEHIGTGNGYPRGTIRIAFLWEADRRRVVIGYIGRHQRTRAT